MKIAETVGLVEAAGAAFQLDGVTVRVRYPHEERREELAAPVGFLRDHRAEVAAFLKTRIMIPAMPPGVRLIELKFEEPPIAIDICSVVIAPALYAAAALEELRERLASSRQKCDWSVQQLIDRLAQVGVRVVLESSAAAERAERQA